MTPTKTNQGSLEQRTPAFFVPGTWFLMEEIFSQTEGGGVGGGFGMIQARYLYWALYFYYYDIRS